MISESKRIDPTDLLVNVRESSLPTSSIFEFVLLFPQLKLLVVKQDRFIVCYFLIFLKLCFVFYFEIEEFILNMSNLLGEKVAYSLDFSNVINHKL